MLTKRVCKQCGKKLKGQQQKWCSQSCATQAWYKQHPDIKRKQNVRWRSKKSNRERIRRYMQVYYQNHKEEHKRWWTRYRRENYEQVSRAWRAWRKKRTADIVLRIREFKSKPCADCGVEYPYYIMELDHVRGRKLCDPSRLRLRAYSFKQLEKELSKCDVVCANCHREREYRRGWNNQNGKVKAI